NLQQEQGVGVKGLILISPVMDFREFTGSSLLQYVASLPTFAAVAREGKANGKPVTRADLADVEKYASGDFLADLVKGQADQAVSRRMAGRFDGIEFRREFDRRNGRITGRYDASVSGPDPFPDSSFLMFSDPSGEGVAPPI